MCTAISHKEPLRLVTLQVEAMQTGVYAPVGAFVSWNGVALHACDSAPRCSLNIPLTAAGLHTFTFAATNSLNNSDPFPVTMSLVVKKCLDRQVTDTNKTSGVLACRAAGLARPGCCCKRVLGCAATSQVLPLSSAQRLHWWQYQQRPGVAMSRWIHGSAVLSVRRAPFPAIGPLHCLR